MIACADLNMTARQTRRTQHIAYTSLAPFAEWRSSRYSKFSVVFDTRQFELNESSKTETQSAAKVSTAATTRGDELWLTERAQRGVRIDLFADPVAVRDMRCSRSPRATASISAPTATRATIACRVASFTDKTGGDLGRKLPSSKRPSSFATCLSLVRPSQETRRTSHPFERLTKYKTGWLNRTVAGELKASD